MIQIEIINENLCSSCGDCCKAYDNKLRESYFVTKKEGDFFENALEQFGVYPKRNPLLEFSEYCEFHDPSLGCIIERSKRPLTCRTYACYRLYQDFQELRKISFDGSNGILTTELVIDNSINSIVPTYNDVDLNEFELIVKNRTTVCLSCPEIDIQDNMMICKKCGCSIFSKIFKKYPLDDNGKAYSQILPNGLHYVCPLKKW